MRSIHNQFARFIVVGIINTGIYYTVYLLCFKLFQFTYLMAHFLGFTFSLVCSFLLNTYFTYKVKPTLAKFIRFPLTQAVNLSLSTILLFVFIEWFHINSSLAPIFTVPFTIPVTFIVTRRVLQS